MNQDLDDFLGQLEAAIRRLARPTVGLLNPGIEADRVRQLLRDRGLEPTTDLARLWAWRNGTEASTGAALGDLWLVPGFYLLSVQDATINFDAFVQSPRWNASWLPLMADGGGDFLAVNCSRDRDHGSVYRFRIDQSEHPMEYRTVERMVATFAAAFDRGTFYVDDEGYLDQNDAEFAALAAELNPSIAWWTAVG